MNFSNQRETRTTTAEISSGQNKQNQRHRKTTDEDRKTLKKCIFESITVKEILISNFMTAMKDKKLRDKLMKESNPKKENDRNDQTKNI